MTVRGDEPGEAKRRLVLRLRELIGFRDAGNGTPLADAVACAIVEDARAAKRPWDAIDALDAEALNQTAEGLGRLISGTSHDLVLPFGTAMGGLGLEIAGQRLMLDAARPGLHPYDTIREDAHGPNLDLLIAFLRRRMGDGPYDRFGLPVPTTVGGWGPDHCLEFPPFAEAGGVVLRHSVSSTYYDVFCSLSRERIETMADTILGQVEQLWMDREMVGARVAEVRRAVDGALHRKYGDDAPVKLRSIAIDYERDENDGSPYLYIEYDSIGDALRPGGVVQDLHGDTPIHADTFEIEDCYDHRRDERDALVAIDATGRVEGLAAAVIRAAPEGETVVLERLGRELETCVTIPDPRGDVYARLKWYGGTVSATIRRPSDLITIFDGLQVRGSLPESIMTAAIGRSLGEIVALPFPCETRISEVASTSVHGEAWTSFKLVDEHLLIDRESGALRPN